MKLQPRRFFRVVKHVTHGTIDENQMQVLRERAPDATAARTAYMRTHMRVAFRTFGEPRINPRKPRASDVTRPRYAHNRNETANRQDPSSEAIFCGNEKCARIEKNEGKKGEGQKEKGSANGIHFPATDRPPTTSPSSRRNHRQTVAPRH